MSEDYSLAMSTQYSIGVHDGVEIANAKLNEMKDIINKMFDSIQRVRELLTRWDELALSCGCLDLAIQDVIKALDGEL